MKLETEKYYWFKHKNDAEWRLGLIKENDIGQQFVFEPGDVTWQINSGAIMEMEQFDWLPVNHPDADILSVKNTVLGATDLSPGLTLTLSRDADKIMEELHADTNEVDHEYKARQMAQSVLNLLHGSLSRRMTKWLTVAFLDELKERMEGLHVPSLTEVQRAASFLLASVALKDNNLPTTPGYYLCLRKHHDAPEMVIVKQAQNGLEYVSATNVFPLSRIEQTAKWSDQIPVEIAGDTPNMDAPFP
jgi:hypothetical protein